MLDTALLITSLAINISVIDDILVDFLALGIKCLPPRFLKSTKTSIGVFIANWQESEVLPVMIHGNLATIIDPNIVFYLGVYPNDLATLEVAQKLQQEFPNRIIVVINSLNGPTSKGQMLNELFSQVFSQPNPPDIIVLHDSEDRIDPESFCVYGGFANIGYDFIQTPVFSLPASHRSYTGATYEDGFAELHTRGMIVRSALGIAVPSAGVGTGLTQRLVRYFIENRGTVLQNGTLVEDYMLGHEAHRAGFRCVFTAPFSDRNFTATREYFPSNINAAIRQKSRWIFGIVFEGTQRLGWYGNLIDWWFLIRDRKPAVTGFLAPLATMFLLILATEIMSFENTPYIDLLKWSMWFNAVGMVERYVARMIAHRKVYGTLNPVGILFRWPVEMYIDFRALLIAWRMFLFESHFATQPVAWVKTTHDITSGMFNVPTRIK